MAPSEVVLEIGNETHILYERIKVVINKNRECRKYAENGIGEHWLVCSSDNCIPYAAAGPFGICCPAYQAALKRIDEYRHEKYKRWPF